MANFKYTVANKDGKKLSGTVEAPDEKIAREELNNLGFSILSLKETTENAKLASHLTKFVFEAYDKSSKFVTGTIPAISKDQALKKLKNQYNLNINAIWEEGANKEIIGKAKNANLIKKEALDIGTPQKTNQEQEEIIEKEKENKFFKEKIDYTLKQVKKLLTTINESLDPNQKAEINKKMDKLLRIKYSKNHDYILETAKDLLNFLEEQGKSLQEKGLQNQRLQLRMKTKSLLSELNKDSNEKSFSESIVAKIDNWQNTHQRKNSAITRGVNGIFNKIKDLFTTEPEVKIVKEQIKTYNKQIWELIQLYFKEPTPTYKKKVKTAMSTVWKARKAAKIKLKEVKKHLKEQKALNNPKDENLLSDIITEINSFTGWLLALYIPYYFIALYITSKDFGISEIPEAFYIYESHIFKYVLVTLFLLHATTALKVNFFKKNLVADICLPIIFFFSTVVALLNF